MVKAVRLKANRLKYHLFFKSPPHDGEYCISKFIYLNKQPPRDAANRPYFAIIRCGARHTSQEFVSFLDEAVVGQRRKQIHLILDNLATHKTAAVRAWLEKHPQVQLHFTPTYSSWLNQVEIWLGMITRDCLRRGIFRSVPDLVNKIMAYVRL